MTQTKNRRERTLYLVQLAILSAILLLLEVTGLGYIRIPAISMTIMQVPVIIGALVLGPAAGAILGTVFGLTSFAQAFGKDPLGAILLSLNPAGLFVTTVLTRALMGWLCGLIFLLLKKTALKESLRLVLASLSGALLNTLLFMTAFILFFFSAPSVQEIASGLGTGSPLLFAVLLVGVQGLIEAVVCTLLGSAISRALLKTRSAKT